VTCRETRRIQQEEKCGRRGGGGDSVRMEQQEIEKKPKPGLGKRRAGFWEEGEGLRIMQSPRERRRIM